jgi:hypothetical protein
MATHNDVLVNTMRRRVIELDGGIVVRDEDRGFYDSGSYEVVPSEAVSYVEPATTGVKGLR